MQNFLSLYLTTGGLFPKKKTRLETFAKSTII